MATKIITKNSSTTTAIPTAADLVQGELAVNVTDKRLFTENSVGAIVELGTSPSTIDINAGTIDGTVIGGTTAAAGSFTTGTFSGDVGVGNSSPTADMLGANGGLVIGNGTGAKGLMLFGSATSQQNIAFSDTSASQQGLIQYDHGGDYMRFFTNSLERFRLDSAGNVGIGNSAPASIVGGTATSAVLTVGGGDGSLVTGDRAGSISFKSDDASYKNTFPDGITGEIASVCESGVGSSYGMSFYTGTVTNSSREKRLRIGATGDITHTTNAGACYSQYIEGGTGRGYIGASNSLISSGLTGICIRGDSAINFSIAGANNMTLDAGGNLLVGTTTTNIATEGTVIYGSANEGVMQLSSTNMTALYVNRSNSGELVQFRTGGNTTVGSIGTNGGAPYFSGPLAGGFKLSYFNATNATIFPCTTTGASADAVHDLGYSAVRFRNIYRSGSTISTSDRNMKQDIRDLTDAERNVAVACKSLLKAFRFIDVVEKDGNDANIHFGIIAQDLAAAFEAEGLDANDYQVYRADTFTDEDEKEQVRLGVCYENLLAFIIAAI